MTRRHLRFQAIVAPIVIVLILEGLRTVTIGSASLRSRLILDGFTAIAFIVFGLVMVRAIGRANQKLERQNAELLALHGAGLDVSAELALDAVLNKVVERARALVGARYGALSVVNDDGSIQTFLTSGVSTEQRARIGAPPVGHGLLGVVLREGEHLRLPDIGSDPRSYGFPPNHPVMHSLLAVPVTCKGPFVGNLYFSEKERGGEFTASDEETMERFAVQAAIAIDNAHLHRQVADLAIAQERLRIAHEMHDGIAQVLGYVNTKVQAAIEYIRRSKTEEGLEQLRELGEAAREAYRDVRESIVDLRTLPGPTRSFQDVLEEYIDRWKEQTGISTQFAVDDEVILPPNTELQLVRIIQESLANVRKHSKATRAEVDVRTSDGKLLLTVSDNGVGFSQALRGRSVFPRFGLSTMRERAESIGATFSIESTPGAGTRIRVEFPVPRN
jgi:signal transduction histidine kinase